MTLEQLRIFIAVAKHLHFTRAAEELYITQPAVSAAVNSLEKEYEVKLFHRVGRHIEITEAGKFLEIEAQKIIAQVISMERGLQELNSFQRGELRLGSSLTIGNYWLPDRINRFKQHYPRITIHCSLGNAEEICDKTASGIVDIGLITGSIKNSLRSVLMQQVVGSDRWQIVVGKNHPWYNRKTISADEIMTSSWIIQEPGSGIREVFETTLEQLGVDPLNLKIELVLTSSEMVKRIVEKSNSAAAISELMLTNELQLGSLHTVKIIAPKKMDI